jgi:hypothetical protein
METLPEEVVICILESFDLFDLIQYALTSKISMRRAEYVAKLKFSAFGKFEHSITCLSCVVGDAHTWEESENKCFYLFWLKEYRDHIYGHIKNSMIRKMKNVEEKKYKKEKYILVKEIFEFCKQNKEFIFRFASLHEFKKEILNKLIQFKLQYKNEYEKKLADEFYPDFKRYFRELHCCDGCENIILQLE